MSRSFEKAITIRQAIRNIDNQMFLLPAIQRNFVWLPTQMCVLFDSLMREYPINTFMMWNVTSPEIKNKYRFYSFLTDYCQRFKASNDYVPTQGNLKNFKAVNGQQRLAELMTEKHTGIKPVDQLMNEDDSLHFAHLQTFCEKCREALMQRLRRNVVVSETFSMIEEVLDEDEEIEAVA